MGQMGFFDLGNRYSGLDAKNEPLLKIDGVVPWEDLRARLEAVWRRADKARKSRAGRRAWLVHVFPRPGFAGRPAGTWPAMDGGAQA